VCRWRENTVETLLPLCEAGGLDIDTRLAAVDGLGFFFRAAIVQTSDAETKSELMLLQRLISRSASVIAANLQECSRASVRSGGAGGGMERLLLAVVRTAHSLLVSVYVRPPARCQFLINAPWMSDLEGLVYEAVECVTQVLDGYFDIVESALEELRLGSPHLLCSGNTSPSRRSPVSSPLRRQSRPSSPSLSHPPTGDMDGIPLKLVQHSLYMLAAAASFNPVNFLQYWRRFLQSPSDSTSLGVCLFSYLNRPPVPSRNKDAVPLVVKCVQAAASAIATIVDLPYDTLSFDSVKEMRRSDLFRELLLLISACLSLDRTPSRVQELLKAACSLLFLVRTVPSATVGLDDCVGVGLLIRAVSHRSLGLMVASDTVTVATYAKQLALYNVASSLPLPFSLPPAKVASDGICAAQFLSWLADNITSREDGLLEVYNDALSRPLCLKSGWTLEGYLSFMTSPVSMPSSRAATTSVKGVSVVDGNGFSVLNLDDDETPPSLYTCESASFVQLLLERNILLSDQGIGDADSDVGKLSLSLLYTIGSMAQTYFGLFVGHMPLIERLLSVGFSFPSPAGRVMCVRVATALASSCVTVLRDKALCWQFVHNNLDSTDTAHRTDAKEEWVCSTLRRALECSNDVEHQVRVHAAVYCTAIALLRCENPGDIDIYSCIRDWSVLRAVVSFRIDALKSLIRMCADPVVTVRVAACKELGEAIQRGALQGCCVSGYHVADAGLYEECTKCSFYALTAALSSPSKLQVRMQSMWALGHLLKDLLPHRLREIRPGLMQKDRCLHNGNAWTECICDSTWRGVIKTVLGVIEGDPDKILPATTRVLSISVPGLRVCFHPGHVDDMLLESTTVILTLIFGRMEQHSVIWRDEWNAEVVMNRIQTYKISHSKLLFGMCQSAGSILWTVLSQQTASAVPCSVDLELDNVICVCFNFLLCMMRQRSYVKLQLQACRCVIVATQFFANRVVHAKELFLCMRAAESALLMCTGNTANDDHLQGGLVLLHNTLKIIHVSLNVPFDILPLADVTEILFHSMDDLVLMLIEGRRFSSIPCNTAEYLVSAVLDLPLDEFSSVPSVVLEYGGVDFFSHTLTFVPRTVLSVFERAQKLDILATRPYIYSELAADSFPSFSPSCNVLYVLQTLSESSYISECTTQKSLANAEEI